MTTWVVYASEVASFIGEHRYQPTYETMLKILARANRITYESLDQRRQKVLSKMMNVTKVTQTQEIISTEMISQCVDHAIKKQKISEEEALILRDHLPQITNQLQGQASELRLVHTENIQENNTELKRYRISDNILIVGRIDGLLNNHLIEIKRRVRPIQPKQPIPPYDKIQCFCYMKMTGQEQITLKELGSKQTSRDTVIDWEAAEWKRIEEKIAQGILKLDHLSVDQLTTFQLYVEHQEWEKCHALLVHTAPETPVN